MCCRMATLMLMLCGLGSLEAADIIIKLPPDNNLMDTGVYRLDYSPPIGVPATNTTFQPSDIQKGYIYISQALPGTKYNLSLSYTSATISNHPFLSEIFTTTPDPPSNLTVVMSEEIRIMGWTVNENSIEVIFNFPHPGLDYEVLIDPPDANESKVCFQSTESGQFEVSFLGLFPDREYTITSKALANGSDLSVVIMKDRTLPLEQSCPSIVTGSVAVANNATYLTIDNISHTEAVVSWDPPGLCKLTLYCGYHPQYKVNLLPLSDKLENRTELTENHMINLTNLMPGATYELQVYTIYEGQPSQGYINASFTTVPLEPSNVTLDSVSSNNFTVSWSSPEGETEFDHYVVYSSTDDFPFMNIEQGQPLKASIMKGIEPGNTYQVSIRTVISRTIFVIPGNNPEPLASCPVKLNITTQPLPVLDLKQDVNPKTGELTLMWKPDPASKQDGYRIEYIINDATMSVNNTVNTKSSLYVIQETNFFINDVQPGINYTITVKAVSNGIESSGRIVHQDVPRI